MKANWERYKVEYPEELRALKTFGPNPYNFVNKIHMLATGRDPNSSRIEQQTEALAQLERLVLTDYRYAKSFLKEYYYFASISGNYFTQSVKDKLFQKLPGQLGEEIRQKWHPINDIPENDNIGVRIQHIIKCAISLDFSKSDPSFSLILNFFLSKLLQNILISFSSSPSPVHLPRPLTSTYPSVLLT